jgi:hypothetical protein
MVQPSASSSIIPSSSLSLYTIAYLPQEKIENSVLQLARRQLQSEFGMFLTPGRRLVPLLTPVLQRVLLTAWHG